MASNAALDISIAVETQHREMEIWITRRTKQMTMRVEKSTTPYPIYEGPYSVTPRLYFGETLQTRNLAMADNISVEAIQVYEVENPSGGKTVTIGTI